MTIENAPGPLENDQPSACLQQALALMQANLDEPIAQALIAEQVGLSRRQLERVFARYWHTSPRKYYLHLRLAMAHQLLLDTTWSVTSIALEVGFNNFSHFSTCFTKAYGLSPSKARQEHAFTPGAFPLKAGARSRPCSTY